jgi:hypothetical protein
MFCAATGNNGALITCQITQLHDLAVVCETIIAIQFLCGCSVLLAQCVVCLSQNGEDRNFLQLFCKIFRRLQPPETTVTNDETWVFQEDPETKQYCFFYIKGTVHYEFVPQKQTSDQAIYLHIWEHLWSNIH